VNIISILNRLFGTSASVSSEIVKDDVTLFGAWLEFTETYAKKAELVAGLKEDSSLRRVTLIKTLIGEELVNIHGEEHLEEDIIKDLRKLKHESRIRRIDKLEACLNYGATRYEYAHKLLEELYHVLRRELHVLNNLSRQKRFAIDLKVIYLLKKELEVEKTIIEMAEKIVGKFHEAFTAIAKGQRIIQTLTEKEKALVASLKKQLDAIFSGKEKEGFLAVWAIAVDDIALDFIEEMQIGSTATRLDRVFDGHYCADFEFVNSPEFAKLAKDKIPPASKSLITDEVFNVFMHVYRDWFNHKRFEVNLDTVGQN
jgi:hypothetical protein